ncbi:MAG TPA: phosphate acyltransferase PlsX, partial [Solirubrobacterales bacterium]|nr:phosphate acyltransferase PlsX [Solirubrobacterales bacterium]
MAPGRAVTVALDGYGAERGFDVLARGARLAASDGIGVRVFGPRRALGLSGVEGIEVVDSSERIGNEEDPVPAVRAKKQAS